jgi:hypothetical protein
MTATLRNLLIAGAVFAFIGIGFIVTIISWNNGVVAAEQGVLAQWRNNQNEYDSFWKKVQEVAQVPGKYKEDFKDLLVSETSAKYGASGSQATFQWFKDRDINFSSEMYVKVQNVIESGRNDFKRGQTELVDKQRRLTTEVKQFPGSMLASLMNVPAPVHGKYAPKEDIDGDGKLTVLDYPIVTSSKTEAVFESGKDDAPIAVFGTR